MREVGEKGDFTKPPLLTFLVLETRSMILPSFKLMFPVGGNISRHTFYLFICIHFATFKQSEEKRAAEDKMVGSMDMSLSKLRERVKQPMEVAATFLGFGVHKVLFAPSEDIWRV